MANPHPRRENLVNGTVPKENGNSIDFALELMSWPLIDLADAEAMERRLRDYLELCRKYDTKPIIAGMCASIGSNRPEVMRWSQGKRTRLGERLTPSSAEILQKYLNNLEILWEYNMQNGGFTQPVTGIFLGKNNFGYKDTSETVVRHEGSEDRPTRAQLEEKYRSALPEREAEDVEIEDPDQGRLPDSTD